MADKLMEAAADLLARVGRSKGVITTKSKSSAPGDAELAAAAKASRKVRPTSGTAPRVRPFAETYYGEDAPANNVSSDNVKLFDPVLIARKRRRAKFTVAVQSDD